MNPVTAAPAVTLDEAFEGVAAKVAMDTHITLKGRRVYYPSTL